MPKDNEVDIDAVLAEVGHFGCYQLRLFLLIVFPVIFSACAHSQYIFAAADTEYRCFVPECESHPGQWKPGAWAEWALVNGSSCTRRKSVTGKCEKAAFSRSTQQCDSWVYENNDTIVAEFNLACKDWQRTLVGTVHSVGVFTAYTFVGIVSDSIGRRTTLIASIVFQAITGVIRSFANSYIFYIVLEYFEAVFGGGIYGTGFVLVVEMVGKHKRVLCGSALGSTFAIGLIVLAGIAWAFQYWRTFTRVIYVPALFVITYYFCLSESVRWLISKNQKEAAIHVLQKLARINGKSLSTKTINDLNKYMTPQQNTSDETDKPKAVWRQICRSKVVISRVLICSFCWITSTFVYYGISLNSVSLAGNKYVNFMLTALCEIPGCILTNFFLDRFGRKATMITAFLTCGLLLFLLPFVPEEWNVIPSSLAKTFISMAFVSIYILTTELFPTNARHSLMAVCSMIGRIGSISAPSTPLLFKIKFWLPYVMFGVLACIASVLLFFVPETLRKPLPETVSQAENIHNAPQSPVS